MKVTGECVGFADPATSPPLGASAPPITIAAGLAALIASYVFARSAS